MPKLEAGSDFVLDLVAKGAVSSGFSLASRHATEAIAGGITALTKLSKDKAGVAGAAAQTTINALDTIRRFIDGRFRMLNVHYPMPGFLSVYKDGILVDIINFQFQAKITSDSRTAVYESEKYGVNELDYYNGTPLRELTLETLYANLDPFVYSAHQVEKKVRKLQALLYPGYLADNVSTEGAAEGKTNNMALLAPPVIGLFIGDKFLRRRLPNLEYDSSGDSKFSINAPLHIPVVSDLLGSAFWEPIYWKVMSVDVSWDDSPVNVDFAELSNTFIPGASKLPMYQKVSMTLKEHKSPNVFERDEDAEQFNTLNNAAGGLLNL